MSDESSPDAAARIREAVDDVVDRDEVESLLAGEERAGSVGRTLGCRAGAELGAIVGRELGRVIAVDVRERKRPLAIVGDVERRLGELLRAAVRNTDVEGVVRRLVAFATDGASGSLGLESSERQDGDEGDGENGGDERGDGTEGLDPGEMSADDLREFKAETYRDLLEVMSYRNLQSIAKETGVKANLNREEMTDRIVEEFSEGGGS